MLVLEYCPVKFGGDQTTNKGETDGGTMCPLQPMFYQNSPTRIGVNKLI